jgi:hypothetical protein
MNFKQLYNDAIDSLIDSFERPCKIYYPTKAYINCSCTTQYPAARKGPSHFPAGNTGSHTGMCPLCKGEHKIPVENSEELSMIVIFDFKSFYKINPTIDYSQGFVQTLCSINYLQKIKSSDYIYFNTLISDKQQQKYQRLGEPQPIGLGSDRYIITDWERR